MKRLEFTPLRAVEAYRLFRASPEMAQQIVDESLALSDQAERGVFVNSEEAIRHATNLFFLASIYANCEGNQKEFFHQLAELEGI